MGGYRGGFLMVGPCKCYICTGPPTPHHCFDCGHEFKETDDEFRDRAENPMCEKCYMKMVDKADALRKLDEENRCWVCGGARK